MPPEYQPSARLSAKTGTIGLGRSVFDYQVASNNSKRFHDLTDMGVAVWVEQLADGRLAQAQTSSESRPSDALCAQGRIEGQLGRGNRRHGDEFLAIGSGTWRWYLLSILDVHSEHGDEGIFGHLKSLSAIIATGQSTRNVGEGCEETPFFFWCEDTRIDIAHESEILSVDIQVF